MYQEAGDLKDPKMGELREDFLWAVNQRESNVYRRQRINFDSRNCVWANQSDDGRKWEAHRGEDQVFPWPGASDARVPLIDLYVNKDVALINVLTARMPLQVRPTESNDTKFATTATSFLRWMIYEQMSEWRTEHRLLANYLFERGTAVMRTIWDKRTQLGYEEIDLEQIITRIMGELQGNPQADQRLRELPQMLMNPAFDEETAKIAADFYPDVKPAVLKRAVADLRTKGSAKFPRPYLVMNRPRVRAYALHDDFFMGPESTSMEDARSCYVREILSESRLRDRTATHDWKEAWVEEMIETQRGKFSNLDEYQNGRSRILGTNWLQSYTKMFEVIHAYRRLTDENGVPSIFYTCFNPNLPEEWAYHDLLNYDHGEMPFTLIEREKRSRLPEDARGYGEVGDTWQRQIKAEWDGRIDRASIATLPPSHYPDGMAPDKWGPGVQIPTMSPDRYGFFQPPAYDPGSKEVEASVREFSDEYFGRSTNPEKASENQVNKQDLADTWMEGEKKIVSQVFGLCQQFMPEQFYFAVTKSQKSRTIHATRDEIQGKFSVGISMDVTNLDAEKAKEKLGNLEMLLTMDVNGRIDRDEALTVAFELLDPNLGERLIKPGEEASQAEVDDEQSVFVKLMAGIPVNIKPGQAYQLRLQVLTQMLQQNKRAQQLYATDPQVKEAFEARGKQLQLQLQQRQNAVQGRGGPNFRPKTLSGE